jgi:hypothetical protein
MTDELREAPPLVLLPPRLVAVSAEDASDAAYALGEDLDHWSKYGDDDDDERESQQARQALIDRLVAAAAPEGPPMCPNGHPAVTVTPIAKLLHVESWPGEYEQRTCSDCDYDVTTAATIFTAEGDVPTGRVVLCAWCQEPIAEVQDPTSAALDWYANGGDYGCNESPDTDEEGRGSHAAPAPVHVAPPVQS